MPRRSRKVRSDDEPTTASSFIICDGDRRDRYAIDKYSVGAGWPPVASGLCFALRQHGAVLGGEGCRVLQEIWPRHRSRGVSQRHGGDGGDDRRRDRVPCHRRQHDGERGHRRLGCGVAGDHHGAFGDEPDDDSEHSASGGVERQSGGHQPVRHFHRYRGAHGAASLRFGSDEGRDAGASGRGVIGSSRRCAVGAFKGRFCLIPI